MAFRFKQFTIEDSGCTMPVGTDAMLLGAWALPGKAERILDIGTGCGILSLMMAQKSGAQIDAVEIDEASARKAGVNFRNSPWSGRLRVIEDSVLKFSPDVRYDFILSNPPYFSKSLRSPHALRNRARHDKDLSPEDLPGAISGLLADHGSFALVLPSGIMQDFMEIATSEGFRPYRTLCVHPTRTKNCNRILAQFARDERELTRESLYILDEKGQFTGEYLRLTHDFHYF